MRLGMEYIAAFVDCDGGIGIAKQTLKRSANPMYFVKVGFYSQNLAVLQELQGMVGGGISCSKDHLEYQLQLSPRESEACLREIRPYLRIKQDQADLALQLARHYAENNFRGRRTRGVPQWAKELREALYLEMKRLNHRDSEAFRKNRVNSVNTLNGRAIPSQAAEGKGSAEGVTTRAVSPNNNLPHECPARKGRDSLSSAEPIPITRNDALKVG